ncbi:MAG: thiol-disulfide oxidoreductase DCC family protein [Anaerolineales bacterium]
MQAVMLYDGLCILCTQTQNAVRYLDWLNRVERIDAWDHETVQERFPEVVGGNLLGEIYVRTRANEWKVGFFGMRYIAGQLPLLWPIVPIMYLPGMNRLGPAIYRWIAKRRYAINTFFGNDCADGTCKIPTQQRA